MASNVANYGETNPVYELGFRDVVMPSRPASRYL